MDSTQRFWFPAKQIGWGWGMPQMWQGWLVLATYVIVVLAPVMVLGGKTGGLATLVAVVVGSPLLLWVCFLKGEPPGKRR